MYIQLKDDQLTARKTKDTLTTNLLTTLLSDIQKRAKDDNNRPVTDDDCISTIKKFISNISELIKIQLNADAEKELIILSFYLPQQLTIEQMMQTITDLKNNEPDIKIGAIMNHFKTTFSGQYDGKQLSELIKQ